MSDGYDVLTSAEASYWDIYTRLRELSDWASFTDGQVARKDGARSWLVAQRKQIYRAAQPKADGGDGQGWDVNNRRQRYNQLSDDSLNSGSCRRVCQLPVNGTTPTEKVMISEREMWWLVASVDDTTKGWRESNVGWLVNRRKQVWHLCQEDATVSNRQLRYENLCVATKTGSAYDNWAATHDTQTGKTKPPPPKPTPTPTPPSSRAKAVANARSFLGVSENPAGSNRGDPQPSGWQRRVYGSAGVPWCACFTTCMAWDVGVKGGGSAGVAVIVSMAQNGQGMFRGWTTDPSKVLRGDMAVVGCGSCHIGLVADTDNPCHLIEGNTSPGVEGSQYNGGCVAEKIRNRSEIVGWALVSYP